jgi:hypothetical protein
MRYFMVPVAIRWLGVVALSGFTAAKGERVGEERDDASVIKVGRLSAAGRTSRRQGRGMPWAASWGFVAGSAEQSCWPGQGRPTTSAGQCMPHRSSVAVKRSAPWTLAKSGLPP